MFDKLKAWIEGLFQGVTIRNDQGSGYIKTSPTAYDLDMLKGVRIVDSQNVTNGAAPTTMTATWRVPNGSNWLITEMSVKSSAAGNFTYTRGTYTIADKVIYAFNYAGPSAHVFGNNLMYNASRNPVLLQSGDTLTISIESPVITTMTFTILYYEV